MKRKRTDWSKVPWTAWKPCVVDDRNYPPDTAPFDEWTNSRYQVARWFGHCELLGRYVHLSIKVHDKQAHHDWRDFQRIKNELCDKESEAIELYPAESRLVDTANQYHLFVFAPTFRFPLGFTTRLVAEAPDTHIRNKPRQRPFDDRPADLLTFQELEALGQAKGVFLDRSRTVPTPDDSGSRSDSHRDDRCEVDAGPDGDGQSRE